MLLSFRRNARWRYTRILYLTAALLILADLLSHRLAWTSTLRQARAFPQNTVPVPPPNERIFIASTLWNNEGIIRNYWSDAVVDLATYLGPERVFVSVYESGSYDHARDALMTLDQRMDELGIPHSFTLIPTTHAEEIATRPVGEGWVETPRGKTELRRIPYLSEARNKSLRPLEDLAREGKFFDKILFLNDVVFNTADVVNLLRTRNGDYSAVCPLDFAKPPKFYDTFALRDSGGRKAFSQTFPYFASRISRDALLNGDPVPVQSCWNGMAIFDASPFYSTEPSDLTSSAKVYPFKRPLRFRGTFDSLAAHHLEASECCLIHYDNPLNYTVGRGVYVNPHVRVGYNAPAYVTVNDPALARENVWPSFGARYRAVWWNRLFRMHARYRLRLEEYEVDRRVKAWKDSGSRKKSSSASAMKHEPGHACLINEMQILAGNGWAHV